MPAVVDVVWLGFAVLVIGWQGLEIHLAPLRSAFFRLELFFSVGNF